MIARLARMLAIVGVALALGFYAELLAHAPATGQDFRIFYAAATVLHDGGNPYDIQQLLRAETRLYHPRTASQLRTLAGNPYVQGPPLAIALLPATGRPPASVYALTALLLIGAAAGALHLLARISTRRDDVTHSQGEHGSDDDGVAHDRATTARPQSPSFAMRPQSQAPTSRTLGRALVLLASPVTFLGVLLGQPDAVLLLLIVAALALYRRRPLLTGLILAVGLIKPQIMAGPLILYGALAWRQRQLDRYALGALAGAFAFLGGSAAIAGPAVVGTWLRALLQFGGATVYAQVDISSLSTLYIGWAPHILSLILSAVGLLLWLALCQFAWRYIIGRPLGFSSSRPPRPLRGSLGGWLPPDPRQATTAGATMLGLVQDQGGSFEVRAAALPDNRPQSAGGLPCDRSRRRDALQTTPSETTLASDGRGHTDNSRALPALPIRGRAPERDLRAHADEADERERWWLLLCLTGWLLATPYAHPHDDALLLPAAWYLLDHGPYRRVERPVAALLLVTWWLLPMTNLLGLHPPLLRGLGVIPIALLLALLALRRPGVSPNRAIGSYPIAS